MSIAETEYDPWARYIVGYDSTKVQKVKVREHIDGIDLVETVTVRLLRVWEKTDNGLVSCMERQPSRPWRSSGPLMTTTPRYNIHGEIEL